MGRRGLALRGEADAFEHLVRVLLQVRRPGLGQDCADDDRRIRVQRGSGAVGEGDRRERIGRARREQAGVAFGHLHRRRVVARRVSRPRREQQRG
jgi:hypothetical protein